MGQNRVKSFPLKYSKLPIKLAKVRVLNKKIKCSVLYLFQITGENFSLIGALEGTFAAEGCNFYGGGKAFFSLLRKTFIIFSFQNNNPNKLYLVLRESPDNFTTYSTIFIA